MKNTPYVNKYLDDEEKELIKAIESDRYEVGKNLLTVKLLQNLQEAARNTMSEASTKVSIRLPRTNSARVKARALKEGLPYQTLIKSIIHQAIDQ
jgi:predicted DNA binding CopG/RHH family protein|tara:strand:- start:875 stop:1159 length:285 start_codon:yes stop_codon:yes gene_type:complete